MRTSRDATPGNPPKRFWLSSVGRVVLICLVALAAAACNSSSSGPQLLTAQQLTTRILPAPEGYETDPTPHASGVMTPAVFDQFGGAHSPSKAGFFTGFKQSYVNPDTGEALIVTVIEFNSTKDASNYFVETRPITLNYAGATLKPFPAIPGAYEAVGTKPYNGGYYHAIVDTAHNFYFQVAYAAPEAGYAPVELPVWAALQYEVLLKRS